VTIPSPENDQSVGLARRIGAGRCAAGSLSVPKQHGDEKTGARIVTKTNSGVKLRKRRRAGIDGWSQTKNDERAKNTSNQMTVL